MNRVAVALSILVALTAAARADRQRVLVLPLPDSSAIDADVARAFDARLLVALEDTGRITTVTPTDEPECTTIDCLAQLAGASRADAALSLSIVRETDGLTLFATLIDAATGATGKRAELSGLAAADVARTAPADIARQIAGGAARTGGAGVLGVIRPGKGAPRSAADGLTNRLAALGTFTVMELDAKGDRADLTHRADLSITSFSIVNRVHHVHHYLDGVLVGTLTITDLTDGRVVFTKSINVTESRRARKSSVAEVTALLVEDAVADWMSAFIADDVEARLQGGT